MNKNYKFGDILMKAKKAKCDEAIFEFIDWADSVTIEDVAHFYKEPGDTADNMKSRYASAARRLRNLKDYGDIKSVRNRFTNKIHYYIPSPEFKGKPLSDHRLLINSFIMHMYRKSSNITYNRSKVYLDGKLRPDLRIIYNKRRSECQGKTEREIQAEMAREHTLLIEVDCSHYTDKKKIDKYEELYQNKIKEGINVFTLVIVTDKKKISFPQQSFDIIQYDYDMNYIRTIPHK